MNQLMNYFTKSTERKTLKKRINKSPNNNLPSLPHRINKPIEDTKKYQKKMHALFIDSVRESRGDRLTGDDDVVFWGDYWIGQEAIELGLSDGISTIECNIVDRYNT